MWSLTTNFLLRPKVYVGSSFITNHRHYTFEVKRNKEKVIGDEIFYGVLININTY